MFSKAEEIPKSKSLTYFLSVAKDTNENFEKFLKQKHFFIFKFLLNFDFVFFLCLEYNMNFKCKF